ncbi:hypothetical protein [Flavobacterium sp.]|uniref:hypothetical protein n=1 Tax=Flavobacterium sp. TaxID=239 RepID=UPI003D10EFA8
MACIAFDENKLKVLLVEVKDRKSKDLRMRNFWSERLKTQPISSLTPNDIADALIENIKKLNFESSISNDKIYILSESQLFDETAIKQIQQKLSLIQFKNINFIGPAENCKLVFESLQLPDKSMVIDANFEHTYVIGHSVSGVSKNGFGGIELKNTDYKSIESGVLNLEAYKTNLNRHVNDLFLANDFSKKNEAIYLTGDWSWAFYTLFGGGSLQNEFAEIKLEDLQKHQVTLEQKFYRYESLATANIEGERVLKNFNKEQLLVGNSILLSLLDHLKDSKDKRLFYAQNFAKAKMLYYLKNKL